MGIRTPGLFIANEALYQLSYTPKSSPELSAILGRRSSAKTARHAADFRPSARTSAHISAMRSIAILI